MTEDLPSNGVKGHNFDSVNVAYMVEYPAQARLSTTEQKSRRLDFVNS